MTGLAEATDGAGSIAPSVPSSVAEDQIARFAERVRTEGAAAFPEEQRLPLPGPPTLAGGLAFHDTDEFSLDDTGTLGEAGAGAKADPGGQGGRLGLPLVLLSLVLHAAAVAGIMMFVRAPDPLEVEGQELVIVTLIGADFDAALVTSDKDSPETVEEPEQAEEPAPESPVEALPDPIPLPVLTLPATAPLVPPPPAPPVRLAAVPDYPMAAPVIALSPPPEPVSKEQPPILRPPKPETAKAEPKREPPRPLQVKRKLAEPKKKPDVKPTPPRKKDAGRKVAAASDASRKGAADGERNASRKPSPSGREATGRQAEKGNAAVSNYPGKIITRLRAAMRFPKDAKGKGLKGEARVAFTVTASGGLGSVRLLHSSGNAALDRAALETVRRAAPFPPIPLAAGRRNWAFVVPLAFTR